MGAVVRLFKGDWKKDENNLAYVTDSYTGKKYRLLTPQDIRKKGLFLATVGGVMNGVGAVAMAAKRALRLLSFYHFWSGRKIKQDVYYEFSEKMEDKRSGSSKAMSDLKKLLLIPFTLAGAQVGALYTLVNPQNGRKFYVICEENLYDNRALAPSLVHDQHPSYEQ